MQEALENERLTAELQAAFLKAMYYDTFVNPMECTNIRATVKELGIPEKRFTRYLLRHRYLYRAPSGISTNRAARNAASTPCLPPSVSFIF